MFKVNVKMFLQACNRAVGISITEEHCPTISQSECMLYQLQEQAIQ